MELTRKIDFIQLIEIIIRFLFIAIKIKIKIIYNNYI